MKWPCAFNGLMSTAALLLPLTAATDSRIQTPAANSSVSTPAHVDFKIVIPQVLYLQVGDTDGRTLGADRVAIMSNGRTVSLNATAHAADSTPRARGNVIINTAARKGIAQDAQCRLADRPARPLVCTVSMP